MSSLPTQFLFQGESIVIAKTSLGGALKRGQILINVPGDLVALAFQGFQRRRLSSVNFIVNLGEPETRAPGPGEFPTFMPSSNALVHQGARVH